MNQTPADAGFSLAAGGPLYRLLLKGHLTSPSMQLLQRRVLLFVAVAWLPLLALSLAEGHAFAGVAIPFLHDVETHARLLLALPLVLAAEVTMQRRIAEMLPQFEERGLVTAEATPRFHEALASALRLRDSSVAEILILALVAAATVFASQQPSFMPASAWYADNDGSGVRLTHAGWWFVHFSVPLTQFLLFRMYFRLFIWARLLHQAGRLPLQLAPAHPDSAAGIGFLDDTVAAFAPVLLAHSIIASGWVASRVLFDGRDAHQFLPEMAAVVLVLVAVVLLPLCQFAPRLIQLRRNGIADYGALAASYVHQFDRKWVNAGAASGEVLLGNADIQSLADMSSNYQTVDGMQPVPFGRRAVVQVAAAAALPFLPLALTVVSPVTLIKRLAEALL
jgi:hypothetical protein